VGPLPAYSFATVDVRTIGASELNDARQLLELGPTASLVEIKGAYRQLLQESHPDRNAADDASLRTQEISAAYELLEEYAVNVRHRFDGSRDGLVIVRVRSLTDLRGGTRASKQCSKAVCKGLGRVDVA
jgi:hypothetical protein